MTSKLKCPFCGEEMLDIPNIAQTRTVGFRCYNIQCKAFNHFMPVFITQALIQAKQDLKKSEKCCSAWETQALDYKAEMIVLSGRLEIARQVMKDIDMLLHSRKFDITELGRLNIIQYLVSRTLKATEHKEQNLSA